MSTKTTTASYDTLGIGEKAVERINSALSDYIAGIKNTFVINYDSAKVQAAVKGSSSENAIKQMDADITSSIATFISELENYKDKLNATFGNYKSNDANNVSFNIKDKNS